MQFSMEVDSDFMALYNEVKEVIGPLPDTEVIKKALKDVITRNAPSKRLSRSEKAQLEYVEKTNGLIPKIIRRSSKSPALSSGLSI